MGTGVCCSHLKKKTMCVLLYVITLFLDHLLAYADFTFQDIYDKISAELGMRCGNMG